MKRIRNILLFLVLLSLFRLPGVVSAQDYRFTVTATEVEAYIDKDGTLSLNYIIDFQNDPNGAPIEFVDFGMPTSAYKRNAIVATIDGKEIVTIEDSLPSVPNGFALNLESNAIPPGQTGTVTAWIPGIQNVLYPYTGEEREDYASFLFSPNWFDPSGDKSTATEYRVTIILPPDVQNEESVYYYPQNWPDSSDPDEIGRTAAEERIYFSWYSPNANTHTQYYFGAAFPNSYVPENTIQTKPYSSESQSTSSESGVGFIGTLFSLIGSNFCCFGFSAAFLAFFGWTFYQGTVGAQKRKMEYLPPKMKIEGHGIKRGLTAVEAAIVMEQPMDKVLTMILFGTLKKEAAMVITQDPLELQVSDPMPEGLHPYEAAFLEAFQKSASPRRTALQKMMVDLISSVSKKMKGFSHKETVAYYQDIMQRAWKMVEDADTPEVKSGAYNDTLEWTMLDDNYQDRTRRTFTGPVFVPVWWPRYSPSYRQSIGGSVGAGSKPVASISQPSGGTRSSLPNIPGADFAAGLINGTTGMAAGIVGNLTSFTSGITNRTNPIPQTTRSSSGSFRGGGGSSCACACACAGCACACAGGGR